MTAKKTPKPPEKPEIPPDKKAEVARLLLKGYSWHRAVKETLGTFGLMTAMLVFELRNDPVIAELLAIDEERYATTQVNSRERIIGEYEEAMELARDTGDGRLLADVATKKATLLGILENPQGDELTKMWERMSLEDRIGYIDGRRERLDELRKKLEATRTAPPLLTSPSVSKV